MKPCFRENGRVTAATSSQTSDGAAFLVLMSRDKAAEMGIRPLASFLGFCVGGLDPAYMGLGPIYAAPKVLEYTGLTMDDIKQFRQDGSLTPGHPEYGHTTGVEATTGPLGAGLGMAVGMAMAEAHLAAIFNKPGYPVVDHYTFALCGDGCLMEGISSEAFSLAGTLGLSKLIVLYDSNNISIEGNTDIAFTENVQARMAAFGFQTITVEDGTDLDAIGKAIEEAKADKEHPSFITIKTPDRLWLPGQTGLGCRSWLAAG